MLPLDSNPSPYWPQFVSDEHKQPFSFMEPFTTDNSSRFPRRFPFDYPHRQAIPSMPSVASSGIPAPRNYHLQHNEKKRNTVGSHVKSGRALASFILYQR